MTLGQSIDKIIEALEAIDPDSRHAALSAACVHLKITPTLPKATSIQPQIPTQSSENQTPSPISNTPIAGVADIRSLKESKQPKGAKQMACLVAYYLQELATSTERKESVGTADLEKYFKQAGFPLPKKLEQVLVDCKRAGYCDSSGRGLYKLTPVGYNLVAHNLPSTQ
jgi:hypothetical protein